MAKVTVNTGGLDDGAARAARAMDKTLRTWAFEVERRAKKMSPVDTGFNKNTIYTITPDGRMASNQKPVSQRPGNPNAPSSKGRKRYKPGKFAQFEPFGTDGSLSLGNYQAGGISALMSGGSGPSVAAPAPDRLQAEVRVGAEYAIYLEVGTVNRGATPFLGPAAAQVTPMLDGLMRKNLRAEGL